MYGVITGASTLILTVAVFRLIETKPENTPQQAEYSFAYAFQRLMADRQFLAAMLVLTGSTGTYYVFLAGAPFVMINLYGYSPAEYGMWFALTGLGYMTGNFIAGRWSVKIGAERMVMLGVIPLFIAILLLWIMSPWHAAIALFIPACAFAISNGMCIPNLTSIGLGVKPEFSGTASGLMGVSQLGVGVVLSSVLGVIINDSALPLFVLMSVSLLVVVAGLLVWKLQDKV